MRLISALVVAAPALLSLGLGSPLAAQQVVALTDAPFSAILSVIDNEGRSHAKVCQSRQREHLCCVVRERRPINSDEPLFTHHWDLQPQL